MTSRRPHMLALAAAAALAFAGCGGSSTSTQTTTSAVPSAATTPALTSPQVHGKLTRRRYIRLADTVCVKLKTIAIAGNRIVDEAIAAHQPGVAAEAIQHFYPSYAQELLLLEGIRPPVTDRPRMRRLLGIMEAQTRTLPIYARALKAQNQTVLQAVVKVQQRLATQAAAISRPYGFKVCGR